MRTHTQHKKRNTKCISYYVN